MLMALIFDVDGTLADTEAVHMAAFNHAFKEEGLDWHWDTPVYTQLLEISGGKERIKHHWAQVYPGRAELDGRAFEQLVQRLHDIKTAFYEQAVLNGAVTLRPGVLALMNEARNQGLALAIATTTSPVNIAALLRPTIGADWRSHFVAVGDASSSPIKKPHPQVYEQVLRDMGMPAGVCVAFEDSNNGVRAATAAGIATVITPNEFTAHHDFSGALRVVPDMTHVNVSQLQDWLRNAH